MDNASSHTNGIDREQMQSCWRAGREVDSVREGTLHLPSHLRGHLHGEQILGREGIKMLTVLNTTGVEFGSLVIRYHI